MYVYSAMSASHNQSKSTVAADNGEGGDAKKDRVIYGKNVINESDEIKYKWNAIFHK